MDLAAETEDEARAPVKLPFLRFVSRRIHAPAAELPPPIPEPEREGRVGCDVAQTARSRLPLGDLLLRIVREPMKLVAAVRRRLVLSSLGLGLGPEGRGLAAGGRILDIDRRRGHELDRRRYG
jgi:hypothetical protein